MPLTFISSWVDLKPAGLLPVLDDAGGELLADARKRRELLDARGVDVDLGGGAALAFRAARATPVDGHEGQHGVRGQRRHAMETR